MRTIDDLKRVNDVCGIKNELTLCFRMQSEWGMMAGADPDYNNFFSVIMVDGGTVCCSINYHKVHLEKGDLLVISPQLLFGINEISDDFDAYYLAVDQSSFDGMLGQDTAFKHLVMFYTSTPIPVLHCTDKAQEVVIGFMDQLSHLMQCAVTNVYIDKMMLLVEQSLMLQLVNLLPQNFEEEVQLSHQEEIFRQFVDLLMQNYRRQHDSSFYSERLHISSSYLARILKKLTGRTVKNFIFDLLQKDASDMLKYTDMTIQEISAELGFPEITAFSKFFKNSCGVAPIYYRQNNTTFS